MSDHKYLASFLLVIAGAALLFYLFLLDKKSSSVLFLSCFLLCGITSIVAGIFILYNAE